MNINEEQNPAKLIKLRKRHLILKQHLQISWNATSSASSFLSFMERTDRFRLKDMTIANKCS